MQLNLMESNAEPINFPVEGTCGGMALCASCQCYVNSGNHTIPEKSGGRRKPC